MPPQANRITKLQREHTTATVGITAPVMDAVLPSRFAATSTPMTDNLVSLHMRHAASGAFSARCFWNLAMSVSVIGVAMAGDTTARGGVFTRRVRIAGRRVAPESASPTR